MSIQRSGSMEVEVEEEGGVSLSVNLSLSRFNMSEKEIKIINFHKF